MHVSSGCTNSALTKDTLLADTEEQTALLALIVPHGACCGDKNVILAATFSYSYQDHIYSSPEYFLVADPLMHYSWEEKTWKNEEKRKRKNDGHENTWEMHTINSFYKSCSF